MKKGFVKRLLAGALTGAMAVSMLAGCGSKDADEKSGKTEDGKTKITFWTWTPTDSQFEELKAAFEKKYPDIEIDWWRTAEMSDYQKKVQVALAGGEGPDLFGVQVGSMLNEYSKFAEPMDGLADKYMDGWQDTISESAVDQAKTNDGVMAAMPIITCGQQYMLYNKTLLEENGITEIPKTYDELKAVSDKLNDAGIIPMAMGAKDVWHDVDWFVAMSQQYGPGKIYEAEDGKADWTDPVFADTMKAWKQMFDEKIFEEGAVGIGTYPDARDNYFYARKAAFLPTGTWHVSVCLTDDEYKGMPVEKDEFGMAMFPQIGPNPAVATNGVDFGLCVNKDSKNKEAAMKFVDFMTMGDGQQIWINTLQGSPVNKNVEFTATDKVKYETAQESIDFVNKTVKESTAARKLKYAELENALGVAMQDVATGKDIDKALAEVQKVSEGIER